MRPPDAHDFDTMARTIFGEARGESEEGQIAVAWVIVNRWKSRRWYAGLSIATTCLKRLQFSCWNPGDPTYHRVVDARPYELETFVTIAREVVAGRIGDPTFGATHYYADTIAAPGWTTGKSPTIQIGHHLFFKGIA